MQRLPHLLRSWIPGLIIFLSLFPSLVWLLRDQSVWTWDQSWYALNTVGLFHSLIASPLSWLNDLIAACIAQPPGIAWLGQFFVPLSFLMGSMNSALLLSILVTNLTSLVLIYKALFRLFRGRWPIAITSTLFVAAGPLFISLTHQFFAESLQLLCVSWFFWIFASAASLSRLRLVTHLLLAASVAMAAKSSSPLYCLGFAGLAIYSALACAQKQRAEPMRSHWMYRQFNRALGVAGLASLPLLVSLWYTRNGTSMREHVKVSASAEHWGERDLFFNKFQHWVGAFADHFFLRFSLLYTFLLILAVLVVMCLAWRRQGLRRPELLDVAAGVSFLQIVVSLSIFSLVPNEDGRYLLPLAPYLSLLMAWLLAKLSKLWIWLTLAVFFAQLSTVHAQALGLSPLGQDSIPWLVAMEADSQVKDKITELVSITCSASDPGQAVSIEVGADLNVINPFTLGAIAAARSPAFVGLRSKPCDFISSVKQATTLDPLVRSLNERRPRYLVAIEEMAKLPPWMAPEFTNKVSGLVTPDFARAQGYALQSRINDFFGTSILVYRRG